MAILATLFAAAGRFLGRVLNMALGWATIMLFGRVPESKQLLLSFITLGSLAWVVAIVGVLIPDAGTFLLAAVPRPDVVPEWTVRLVMLIAALVIPLLIGVGGLFLLEPAKRPSGAAVLAQVLRGYPYAFVLAFSLAFMAVVAPVRKLRSILRGWSDAHIPVVIKPGGYERVARDLEAALDQAGLDVNPHRAPRVLEIPAHLLGWAAGTGVKSLIPDRLLALGSKRLEVLVYPSDIAVSGAKKEMARARASIASRLTFTAAYLTSSKEAQQIEDRLERIGQAIRRGRVLGSELPQEIKAIQETLASLVIDYEEWEVLYRVRLQVERDLLRAREAAARGESLVRAEDRSAEASVTERAVETAVGAGFAVAGSLLERILKAGPLARLPGVASRRRAVETEQTRRPAVGASSRSATEARP